jgi:phosphate acetyltransferase
MAKNLFITATETKSGKSAVSLGVMELLQRNIGNVGFFRPLINFNPQAAQEDNDLNLISSHFKLDIPYEDMYAYTTAEANNLTTLGESCEL